MAFASNVELDRVRKNHQLRAYRIVAILRVGVLAFVVGAMVVAAPRYEWGSQIALVSLYAFATVSALILAFTPFDRFGITRFRVGRMEPFAFTAIDVIVLTALQLLSSDGIYPLLIMILLPVLVAVDMSTRRAAVILGFTMVGFALAGIQDHLQKRAIGWPDTAFLFGLYAFMCVAALVTVRIEERHSRSVAALSALREELLAQTMTASEVLQRRISEAIHDGPLQDVLVARQELVELQLDDPEDDRVSRALTGLQSASERLRQATFELHPAVLEQVGLGAAVEQLAGFTAKRSGIEVTTDIDYPVRNEIDPMVFGVARELLSNVVRHSRATKASVTLGITDDSCVLNVADDGVGVNDDTMARRLGEGHIGLASHRARVEAAGGSFVFLGADSGTRVCVQVPLKK
ncbi:sensor histidine kinase [Mycobacterium gordonae]|uniref:Histidine kinase n=1 Tax=Mycobacterium gordonae TaxID=1778 RepID=A0A1X1WXX5_MYCGO|nr:sensor histidine kinase [Mycobacterium gordonae]PJE07042.1 MAG: sensor histidine kinase [Mycobacterium sp.]MBX9983087.1 sensor histidine kinase [Mycobacterium gordonae]MCV7009454.1 sensor histidine kinase [Mycobacterium gordonae]ODR22879.1 histidine kinase [Mycobacterium gordonae]ORV91290.1 histidine kinase [Mycobacterium gordonae]